MTQRNTNGPDTIMGRIATGVIISICSVAVGFGVSQATLAVEVKTQSVELKNLKEADSRNIADHAMIKDMLYKVLDQNQDFINLLKVQNELLMKKIP